MTTINSCNQPELTTNGQLLIGSTGANPVAATLTAGANVTITNAAGGITIAASGGATGGLVGRNRVVNGDMQVWQRGAGGSATFAVPASTTQYTADRWQISTGANEASTVTQSAGATSGSFLAKVQRNNLQTGTTVIRFCTSLTRDMCIGAAGNIVTLSFKALAGANFSAAGGNLTVTVYSGTGSTDKSGINGAFTGSATPISTTAALTGALTNFAFSSAALGATITQLAVEFSFTPVGTAGADDSFSVTDVQLEVANGQNPFDRRNFNEQLLMCQEFYWKTFNYATLPAQSVGQGTGEFIYTGAVSGASATQRSPSFQFPVQMIAAPTVTGFSPSAASAQVYDETATTACTATSISSISTKNLRVSCTGTAGGSQGSSLGLHMTADADLT